MIQTLRLVLVIPHIWCKVTYMTTVYTSQYAVVFVYWNYTQTHHTDLILYISCIIFIISYIHQHMHIIRYKSYMSLRKFLHVSGSRGAILRELKVQYIGTCFIKCINNQQMHFNFMILFVYNIFTNTFRPVIRPSSRIFFWYRNTIVVNCVSVTIISVKILVLNNNNNNNIK